MAEKKPRRNRGMAKFKAGDLVKRSSTPFLIRAIRWPKDGGGFFGFGARPSYELEPAGTLVVEEHQLSRLNNPSIPLLSGAAKKLYEWRVPEDLRRAREDVKHLEQQVELQRRQRRQAHDRAAAAEDYRAAANIDLDLARLMAQVDAARAKVKTMESRVAPVSRNPREAAPPLPFPGLVGPGGGSRRLRSARRLLRALRRGFRYTPAYPWSEATWTYTVPAEAIERVAIAGSRVIVHLTPDQDHESLRLTPTHVAYARPYPMLYVADAKFIGWPEGNPIMEGEMVRVSALSDTPMAVKEIIGGGMFGGGKKFRVETGSGSVIVPAKAVRALKNPRPAREQCPNCGRRIAVPQSAVTLRCLYCHARCRVVPDDPGMVVLN